ncbi:hypothetical protein NDU88_005218 [Pleurodeles waltl]|uniref:Uncharacterized protein n=1 Tax=Pleurodeles waltl TaxID=8319 RepID=A0AAV7M8N9_PLEWA|nr:hypothetical protein NDU88_005218 [Pleurodeles waltl]
MAPASAAAFGAAVPLRCCRASRVRSLLPGRPAPIPSLQAQSARSRQLRRLEPPPACGQLCLAAQDLGAAQAVAGPLRLLLGELPECRVPGPRAPTSGTAFGVAVSLFRCRAPGGPLLARLGPRVPQARSDSRPPGGARAVTRAPLARAASLLRTALSRGSGSGCGPCGRKAASIPSYGAPRSSSAASQGSGHQLLVQPSGRSAASPLQGAGGPLPARSGLRASQAPIRVSGERHAPRSPLIESGYPDAARSSRSSRPPCLVAWPRPLPHCSPFLKQSCCFDF